MRSAGSASVGSSAVWMPFQLFLIFNVLVAETLPTGPQYAKTNGAKWCFGQLPVRTLPLDLSSVC